MAYAGPFRGLRARTLIVSRGFYIRQAECNTLDPQCPPSSALPIVAPLPLGERSVASPSATRHPRGRPRPRGASPLSVRPQPGNSIEVEAFDVLPIIQSKRECQAEMYELSQLPCDQQQSRS